MKKILDYILSCVYIVVFAFILLVFHPLQWLAFNIFGAKAHQKVVQGLNAALLYSTGLMGTVASFFNNQKIDIRKKYFIIANHQSMFDIVGIIWFMRKLNPIFVSKKSLAKGIPSISYNLKHSGAALIDRKDRNQAISEIKRMCKHAEIHGFTPTIFPEGTRSPNGDIKRFASAGFELIIKEFQPDYIVPILISKTGKFNPKGLFPFTSFVRMKYEVMPMIKPENDIKKQLEMIENGLRNALES